MTKGGRIAGGILSLIGAGFDLCMGLYYIIGIFAFGASDFIIVLSIFLTAAILSLVGGIEMLVDKTVGGILALIGGTIILIVTYIPPILFVTLILFDLIILTGGIVGMVTGSES